MFFVFFSVIYSVTNVWVGLRRRVSSGPYEWTDENLQPAYASHSKFHYYNTLYC